jgi:NAD(P)-dependent dehydrogenase (short-subunit alcohol dehydrogenase family)
VGWNAAQLPDLSGRSAIVTGANSGIGFQTAKELAAHGASVVLACRDVAAGEAAAAEIGKGARVMRLDLASAAAVRDFAEQWDGPLDLLINNAGVMAPPKLALTTDGFERQFGTNHLGHFVLTGLLLPSLVASGAGRVVTVASIAHHGGTDAMLDGNLGEQPYNAQKTYSQSKLANLLFALELQRRVAASGSAVRVTSAHPGWTATDLQRYSGLGRLFNPLFAMKPADGALPTLRAATDPDAGPGSYWGPARFRELSGPPVRARINARAQDGKVAARLWDETEKLIGLRFDLRAAPAAAA